MEAEPGPADESNGERSDYDAADTDGVSLRVVLPILVLLVLAAAVYAGYACSQTLGNGASLSDATAHYPPGSVTYLANGRTYLVREGDGSFIALSEIEERRADQIAGCVIRYRASLSASGESGVFRDDCHGVVFNLQGLVVEGAAQPMQRHPVIVNGKTLTVQFKTCLRAGDDVTEPCRE